MPSNENAANAKNLDRKVDKTSHSLGFLVVLPFSTNLAEVS